VVQIVLWYMDSECSKHMTGNRSQLMNFVTKFLGIIIFGNDNIKRIMGYGDYQLGNITISRVYYVEGLGHNLFSVGQFCDVDLEVAFWKNACFIRNLEGVDLLSGSCDTNLYIISLDDMLKTSPICLISKASKTKSWLWHRRLSHLNFACALGKSKKSSHQPKAEDTNQEKLYLLHMDLCGPMRVASINGKMYILVIVDDYSRFTWVRFLRTKDEAPEAIIKCIKNIQVRLNATVRNNGIVERQNRTLVEAARTMLIFSKASLFLWAEAINTTCYTQNRSLIRLRYNKTPYELIQNKKPDLSFFYVFGALCYPTNDNDDLGKLDAKANIGIFVGYTPTKKAFRLYNKRTRKIKETVHVTFNKLTAMAFEQFSSGPGLHSMTPATSSSGLVPNTVSQQPCIPPNRDDWDHLFQPIFDEYFTPPSIVVSPVQEAAALRAVVLADSPMSTSIDQDAPSTSIPSTQEQEHSPNISQGFEESPKTPTFHDDPLHESLHEDSTSQGSSSNVRQTHTPFEHLVDLTLFTQKAGNDLLLMTTKFKMSMRGQMSFFLGLQISQSPRGIFINQSKYASEIVKKYGMLTSDYVDTPMVEKSKLDEDLQGNPINATLYRGMIGSLMYLTFSRPDLIYAVCLCARIAVINLLAGLQRSKSALASREQVENGIVELYFVQTEYQLADIFTKPLPRERFNFLIEKLGQPMHVYKLKKALYSLKQAPRACPRGIFINQSKYASEIVKKYGLLSTNSVDTPMVEKNKMDEDLQGTLAKPTEKHLQAVKRIFRYLKGTIIKGLWYSKDTDMSLTAYADAYHAGCQDTRRSTLGSAQFLDYGFQFNKISLYCDNKSAIALCCNNVQHSRAKHINVCYHFIKEQVENGIVELYFVRTEYQLADFFTKPLPRENLIFIDSRSRDLGHTRDITNLIDVNFNYLHQPWRAFATVINKCLSGKETGMDKICLSRAQILWGMFHKKNIDYVYLLWEDLLFQIENKDSQKTNKMSYPRFIKITIDYFMSKDQSISRRNKMFWHTTRDVTMFTSMRCISRHEDT
ncbi:uncharacterized mitochondrial protein-like protein, partial [Tanacetum coccineum]